MTIKEERILLSIADEDGDEFEISMKRTSQIWKAKFAYCKRKNINPLLVVLYLDGKIVEETATPNDLNLLDFVVLHALI